MRTFVILAGLTDTLDNRRRVFAKMHRLGYPVRFDEDAGVTRILARHLGFVDSNGCTWFMVYDPGEAYPPGALPSDDDPPESPLTFLPEGSL